MRCPKVWNSDKWLGAGASYDRHAEWLATNNVLSKAYTLAFFRKAKDMTAAEYPPPQTRTDSTSVN